MRRLIPWRPSWLVHLCTIGIILAYPCITAADSLLLKTLSSNPKLVRAERLLKDFQEGKQRTRVIVRLAKPPLPSVKQNLKTEKGRRLLSQRIASVQERVLKYMNPSNFKLRNRFKYIYGFSAEVTPEGLAQLAEIPEVVSIKKSELRFAHLAQGIPLMNASTVRNTYSGQGVSIAICDTGIDYNHPKLGGGGFPNSKVIGGYDFGDYDTDPIDKKGHGTCCAGIAAGSLGSHGDYIGGVAYQAKLYALKVSYGNSGSAYDDDIIEAWEWCVEHKNDDPENPILIINTSFGSGEYSSACDSYQYDYAEAAQVVTEAGITLFASSGNEGYCGAIALPACISDVISVGAVYDASLGEITFCIDDNSCIGYYLQGCSDWGDPWACHDNTFSDLVTCYSNSGNTLDLLAPSENCYTTDITGSGGYNEYGNYYHYFSGTSAASPYAAGAAACLQSAAKHLIGVFLLPWQVGSILSKTGDLITDPKNNITKPRINLGKAVELLEGCDYSINPTSGVFPGHGGSGSISVSTGSDCPWVAISNDSWIHITSGDSGEGPGQIFYTVDPNQGPSRQGSITINTITFNIAQAARKTSLEYRELLLTNSFIGDGNAQGWSADDTTWQLNLPFDFPFYGHAYTSLWVSSNGFVDFSSSLSDYSNSDSKLKQNVRIAPLWTDIVCSEVYIHQPTQSSLCIRWEGREFSDSDPINVELILHNNGRIQFNYGDGNVSIGGSGSGPTIGISAGDGVNYLFSSYNGMRDLTNVRSVLLVPGNAQQMPWVELLLLD